ncbi:MAG: ABC-type Fe3+-siderophore transport system [Candidatus Alkanophagales archaeon MCA70_species_1]|nr:ABC-type Fe3+-siderophore transport system [Candidatus Alkanophaga volatiphilum]
MALVINVSASELKRSDAAEPYLIRLYKTKDFFTYGGKSVQVAETGAHVFEGGVRHTYLLERVRHWRFILLVFSLVLFLSVFLATAVGSTYVGPSAILNAFRLGIYDLLSKLGVELGAHAGETAETQKLIILDIRLPRVILGALVGAALAVSGAALQGLFKNPMADPYVIGISSGALFGVTLAHCLPLLSLLAAACAKQVFAFLGSLLAVFLVYNIARTGSRIPVDMLLLAGIATSFLFHAVSSLILYLTLQGDWHQIISWVLGGLWLASWGQVEAAFLPVVICTISLLFFARDLNAMLLGEESALHVGIEVEKVKKIILVLASVAAASAVAVSGTIGFVGLMVPHAVRLVVGPDHRILLPASALAGASFLIWADALARVSSLEIPVGLITAISGVPFFIYLLLRRKRAIAYA